MEPRIDTRKHFDKLKPMFALEQTIRNSGLEESLIHLVKMRASFINGCGYCIDMHSKDARAHGETEQRLYGLGAWRETPYYTDRERSALEWTDTLTQISTHHVSDELFARVRQHFSEDELVMLTLLVVAINGWNRIAIPLGTVPGTYQVPTTQSPPAAAVASS